jgi:hypothetical protein
MRGRDVEEDKLVGPLGVIALSQLHRVARVAQADEVGSLHNPPGIDVQTRNDSLQDHDASVAIGPRLAQ